MEIKIHRKKGLLDNCYGRWIPLAIFFDGVLMGHLATGETLPLSLPDISGILHTGLLNPANSPYIGSKAREITTTSNELSISPKPAVQSFSVRTPGWVLFDFIGFANLKSFSRGLLRLEED